MNLADFVSKLWEVPERDAIARARGVGTLLQGLHGAVALASRVLNDPCAPQEERAAAVAVLDGLIALADQSDLDQYEADFMGQVRAARSRLGG